MTDVRTIRLVAGLLAAGVALTGCSSAGTMFSNTTSRFTSLFGGSGSASAGTAVPAGTPAVDEVDCPDLEIRTGAASMAVTLPQPQGAPADIDKLRYQLSFGDMARQCFVSGGTMSMKVGVQGRIVLGPSGGPGPVSIPLRYAVVREGPEPRTIVTKFYPHPATIEPGQTNATFTAIYEDLSFPIPPGAEIDAYVVYIGFDPQGASARPAPKAAPKRR